MLTLFAISLFLSAFLLFLVQPMIAKMVLPLLGGTPAVWNTCMLFFQVMLLAGYGYVHVLTTRFSFRRQVSAHLMLLCAPLLVLPIGVASHWMVLDPDYPIAWLLGLLTLWLVCRFLCSRPRRLSSKSGSRVWNMPQREIRTFSTRRAIWAACSRCWLSRDDRTVFPLEKW